MARRGQAALEFLTTYGWAFLVILVMIGALAYFGVVDPNRFLPEKCLLSQEFSCRDHQILFVDSDEVNVKLYLINSVGEAVNLQRVNVSSPDGGSVAVCTDPDNGALPNAYTAGQRFQLECDGAAGVFAEGAKTKLTINGAYRLASGKFDRVFTGELYATVQ